MVSDARGVTYEEKLKEVELTTLEEGRKRGDAIETFKTLKGLNGIDKVKWYEIESESSRATRRNTEIMDVGKRRKSELLIIDTARLEIRKNFFSIRAAQTWNDILEEVKEQKTVNAFKNAYNSWKNKSSLC